MSQNIHAPFSGLPLYLKTKKVVHFEKLLKVFNLMILNIFPENLDDHHHCIKCEQYGFRKNRRYFSTTRKNILRNKVIWIPKNILLLYITF